MKKRNFPLYKIFVYVALITLAISIIVPIVWVFLASLKSQLELVSGNPFDLPKQILWSNFADAFVKARMGDYLLNTIIVTALSLVILLVVALPPIYVFDCIETIMLVSLSIQRFQSLNYERLPSSVPK